MGPIKKKGARSFWGKNIHHSKEGFIDGAYKEKRG